MTQKRTASSPNTQCYDAAGHEGALSPSGWAGKRISPMAKLRAADQEAPEPARGPLDAP